jgi:Ni,Fe-hydrogenase III large subunit
MNALPKHAIDPATDVKPCDPVEDLLAGLDQRGTVVKFSPLNSLSPALALEVKPADWGLVAETASRRGFRWVGGWALDAGAEIGTMSSVNLSVLACFEKHGRFLLFRARLDAGQTELPSQTPWLPGANRPERHTRDAFGIEFKGHPDARPWLRHQAWRPDQFPLRKTFPKAGNGKGLTPPDNGYAFQSAQGSGVYEIPVGPVHAGIIEPGHFRFLAVGEQVLNLEERLGYVHKGIEKIAEGRDPDSLARLAGRVSGDTTVGHAWAACMAMERAAGVEAPERGLRLRGILAERERIANHLGDIGAMCNDVAFAFANYQFTRLKELWLRNNRAWFGHRLLMDVIVPGGVARDLSTEAEFTMTEEANRLRRELDQLRPILEDNASLQDRLTAAGVLPEATARALGCLGYVARASGVDFDLRRDAAYAPYTLVEVRKICYRDGDVAARLKVRYDEIYASLDLIGQLLERLREGAIRAAWKTPAEGGEGLGLVEGWRGEILCYVRFDRDSRIGRYYPRDPSVFNWPALERLIHGNIVPDFPLCNKSVNGSYSGHDL